MRNNVQKITRRLLAGLLACVMFVSCAPAENAPLGMSADCVLAESELENGLSYRIIGDEAEITACRRTALRVTIPFEIEGCPVTRIKYAAFFSCVGLTEIVIPDTVVEIEGSAFSSCTGLKSVTLGSNVQTLGYGAFMYCTSLEKYVVSDRNRYYTDVDGVLFSADMKTLYSFPANKSCAFYGVPNYVTDLGRFSFNGVKLLSITVQDNVVNFGDMVFDAGTSIVVYGYEDTPIQTYAEREGLNFVSLGRKEPEETTVEATTTIEETTAFSETTTAEETITLTETTETEETTTVPPTAPVDTIYFYISRASISLDELAKNDNKVSVTVSVTENNEGFSGYSMILKYDEGLVASASDVEFERYNVTNLSSFYVGSIFASLQNRNEVIEGDCKLFDIVFTLPDDVSAGDIFDISFDMASNLTLENFENSAVTADIFRSISGCIEITGEETTTEPEETTTEPEETTTEPEETTTEPEVTTTEPKVTTTEPEITTTAPTVTDEPVETTTERDDVDKPDNPECGDLNGDGKINMTDLSILVKHIVRIKLLEGERFELADVNTDGKVNVTDLSRLAKYICMVEGITLG